MKQMNDTAKPYTRIADSWTIALAAYAAPLILCGCGEPMEVTELESIESVEQPLYLAGNPWPQGSNGVHEVPVCFADSALEHPDFVVLRDRIRRVVNESWGRAANLRFRGSLTAGLARPER